MGFYRVKKWVCRLGKRWHCLGWTPSLVWESDLHLWLCECELSHICVLLLLLYLSCSNGEDTPPNGPCCVNVCWAEWLGWPPEVTGSAGFSELSFCLFWNIKSENVLRLMWISILCIYRNIIRPHSHPQLQRVLETRNEHWWLKLSNSHFGLWKAIFLN